MGENPSVYRRDDPAEAKRHPVENAFLDDCLEFIRRLNNHKEVKAKGLRFRPPKVDERSFVCRARLELSRHQSTLRAFANTGIALQDVVWCRGNPISGSCDRNPASSPPSSRSS